MYFEFLTQGDGSFESPYLSLAIILWLVLAYSTLLFSPACLQDCYLPYALASTMIRINRIVPLSSSNGKINIS